MKVVMYCSSGSSSDSCAKTNQRSFGVYLAVHIEGMQVRFGGWK